MINYTIQTNGTGQGDFNFTKFAEENNLPNGEYEVVAIPYEDNYYTGIASDPITLNVKNPINVTVSNETGEGKVGDEIEVEFTVNSTDGSVINEGKLTVTVQGTEYTADVKDGKATFTFGPFDEAFEVNDLEVTYNGTNKYATAIGYLNLTVTQVNVTVSNETGEGKVGDTIEVEFTLTASDDSVISEGKLTVTVQGTEYTADVKDGKATFTFGPFDEAFEVNDLEVTYNGTNKYATAIGYLNLTVTQVNVTVSNETGEGRVGDEIEVEFTVTASDDSVISEGKLTVTVQGTEYTADVKGGKATFTFGPFDEAFEVNDLEVTYNGTNKYATAIGYLNLTVKKIPVIVIVENITGYNGEDKTVKITVLDAETGEEVTGGTVTYSIDYSTRRLSADGDSYPVDDGEATAETTLNGAPGLYDSEATYSGTNKYEAGSGVGTAEILKLNTTTESEDVSGKKGDTKDITADILDQNGDPVQNGIATLTVDGKEYTAEVKDGKATFKDVELTKNTTATIEYAGNDWYNPSNTTIDITVTEEPEPQPPKPPQPPTPKPDDEDDTPVPPKPDDKDEPQPTPAKTVAIKELPATGNPIAMLLLVLMALVSTISIRRQK